ncbi:DUF4214 domain-containing protein [Sphingomonas sp. PR090111-T3T-6A]|uniref:DUF4214 domain-containing protein n=1 Tax=Sphingomonas sp. PR090111-T3T-6A TaxID=685778 RepID=UPI00138B1715|nr:DUF4214 domain-containing protein [Sphingomonas sp. PR090111-T3T-6A]
MAITFIQSADAFNYKPMLDTTSKTVIEFCRRHGHKYENYVGVKRGFYPWQASFNRLFMLKDLLDAGYCGWVVHMDADAFVHDLDFDLAAYLASKGDVAGILTPMGDDCQPWEINNGVALFNLSHPIGRRIIEEWHARYMAVSDDTLRQLTEWPGDINDQTFLFEILDDSAEIRDAFFFGDRMLLNHPYATFIRQILRAYMPIQADRHQVVRMAVKEILPEQGEDLVGRLYPVLISTLFRVLLRRDIEASAVENFRSRFHEKGIETAFRETFAEILISREYLELNPPLPLRAVIEQGYRWVLGRSPDQKGLDAYAAALENGHISMEQIRADMIGSAEFAKLHTLIASPLSTTQAN